MTAIYAVTKGSYSDYRVVALFSSSAAADRYMAAFPDAGYAGYNDVELYGLDSPLSELDRGLLPFRVSIRRDGFVLRSEETDPEYMGENSRWIVNDFTKGKPRPLPKEEWSIVFYVWAKDKDHAIKIANERRIQEIALEGVTE